jgi:predicted transcriptional regulator
MQTYHGVGMRTILTIGKYSIPNRRLAVLLDQTKRIYDDIEEGNGNSTQIMDILKFKVKSPSYYTNMQDLRAFGLVQGQDKTIRITSVGLRAISEDATQKQAALEEVFDNFELWKKLRGRYGK